MKMNAATYRFSFGCALALVFAAASTQASASANTSPTGGSAPGGVRGHIDIPEIGIGSGPGFQDPFGQIFAIDDLHSPRIVEGPNLNPEPIISLPPGIESARSLVVLFPPTSSGPTAFTDALAPESFWLSPIDEPGASLAPTSSVPAPGVGTVALMLMGAMTARRRRLRRH